MKDEDGTFADWIEIYNPDAQAVSLAGYFLSDSEANLKKWQFPAVTLQPGSYLVVFASGKNRSTAANPLHTNFELSSDGEFLALVRPDGTNLSTAFSPYFAPQFDDISFGRAGASWNFFTDPTPGAANISGTPAGPIVSPLEKNPPQPPVAALTVSARVSPVNAPVAAVTLHYRKMFGPEANIAMHDDGANGDAVSGDGVWSAVIPASALGAGEMTRWRFVARDTQGVETKDPAYRSPTDSPQYYGTVAQDARIRTRLPVFHWFTSNPNGAGTSTGSRGALYYEGEFYDNVLFTLHGQSSSGFPKKSYNIDFNRSAHFRWSTNAARVADIDLLTNWADKSKVRHVLAYEVMRQSGVAAHFAYTVRVQQNGSFFSTADIVEDADETYLERAGLNKDGALYKVYANQLDKSAGNTGTSGVEKKTRKFEGNSDLQALIDGLARTGSALTNFIYDNIDLARCVNMLAASSVIRNIDMHSKNWYIYRDTGRSDEWAMLPWDLDLSHGRVWNEQNTYFDNALYTNGFVVNGTAVKLAAQLFSNPVTRSMLMRRIRTLTDRFLQPLPAAGTPEETLYYERRLNEQSALIDPPEIVPSDARLDFEKWGSWLQGGAVVKYTNNNVAVETMAEGIQRWKNEYLPGRRRYIYNTQIVGRGGDIPLPQVGGGPITNYTPLIVTGAPAKALVPPNGNLGLTWTGAAANEPFDSSGWLSGKSGVGYERATGYAGLIGLNVNTQMQSNTTVYVRLEFDLADPAGIQHLELRMKHDDGFVAFLNGTEVARANAPATLAWNSAAPASHEANPNAFVVYDISSSVAKLRSGRNVLAIQGLNDTLSSSDMIVLPELYAGQVAPPSTLQPKINFGAIESSPASGNQDEEFIQLMNPNSIAVDISDWRLKGAVEHTFTGGTVLPAGGSIYVSPNSAAFRARSVSPKGGEGRFVQGNYRGHLSSFSEKIVLLDDSGETNNTATYQGTASDAQQFLVISEFLYHPGGDGLAEFLELQNISDSVPLDLTGIRFTAGVEFDFSGSSITSLPPGARALVVRDLVSFTSAYGTNLPVAGVFTNGSALNNGGELIKLEDARNNTIREFTYSDQAPWPVEGDSGYSLVLVAPETNPDHALPTNWRASARLGGTPGAAETTGGFNGDPLGDVDRNGEPDLVDYAFGNQQASGPVYPKVVWQPASTGPGTIRFTYPVNAAAADVQIDIYISPDLMQWHKVSSELEFESEAPLANGQKLVTWRVLDPLRAQDRLYFRLGVTRK